jgi:hypothetical protein
MRGWLVWLIGGIWLLTALAVFIATRIHPATPVNIALSVSKFSFSTDAQGILNPSDERQLSFSGTGSLQLRISGVHKVTFNGAPLLASSLEIQGEPYASCAFYHVRSSGIELAGPSEITLEAPRAGKSAFSLQAHGSLSGSLSSRPAEYGMNPGFTCARVRVNGGEHGNVEGSFSLQGGDSVSLAADSNVRLDFVLTALSEIGDTGIPIQKALRFWEIEPGSSEEKTVLLKGKNEVVFESLDKKVTLDDADLLEVVPRNDFYLRRFTVKDGIQLNLHGVASDVRMGPGPGAMENRMPSLFDHLDSQKRIYGVIPALVALIVGIMERMGVFQKK